MVYGDPVGVGGGLDAPRPSRRGAPVNTPTTPRLSAGPVVQVPLRQQVSNFQGLWMKIFRRFRLGCLVGSFDEVAVDEDGAGTHERDQMWPFTARQRSWAASM